MILDLIRAFLTAALFGLAPGYFWAKTLLASSSLTERLVFSAAVSLSLFPAAALLPARFLGLGVTLPVAALSALAVFGAGLAAYLKFGPAVKAKSSKASENKAPGGSEEPLAPSPASPVGLPALAALIPAFAVALGMMLGVLSGPWYVLLAGLLAVSGGAIHLLASPPEHEVEPSGWSAARRLLLPAALLVALARAYIGPVLRDWPFIRGVDHYSHAVMTNLMLSEGGEIEPYLIYPPGFHTLTAAVSRVSGLAPLEIFPVLAPALLLLPPLALYALASRLWGRGYGVAAAFISGMLFSGSYLYFNDAMYPNLVAAQFLIVLTVLALVGLYASPSWRSGLLFALLGSSVVLYHQVSSLYLAALLFVVSVFLLPAALLRDRRTGVTLLLSLALLGSLSVLYAWDLYDLPSVAASLLGVSEPGGTREAVGMAIGTQKPFPPVALIEVIITQPVAWLGLFGAVLLLKDRAPEATDTLPYALARATLFLWLLVVLVGSATSLSGFPQRFGRDLGVPLALFAALALITLLRSLKPGRKVTTVYAASLAVLLVGSVAGLQAAGNFEEGASPGMRLSFASDGLTITPEIAAAGEWLRRNNEGGNIMVSPQSNQVPSRMMLAMGEYSALQSFTEANIQSNRDLPPAGPDQARDVLWVMNNPDGERTRRLLERYDVRYIVLYKDMPDRPIVPYWTLFEARPDLYQTTFENEDVLIVKPR